MFSNKSRCKRNKNDRKSGFNFDSVNRVNLTQNCFLLQLKTLGTAIFRSVLWQIFGGYLVQQSSNISSTNHAPSGSESVSISNRSYDGGRCSSRINSCTDHAESGCKTNKNTENKRNITEKIVIRTKIRSSYVYLKKKQNEYKLQTESTRFL